MRNLLYIFLLWVVIFPTVNSYSQQSEVSPQPRPKNCQPENSCPRNTLFHETNVRLENLFGLNSVNWDHILVCREKYLVSVRIGIDYMSFKHIKSAGIPVDLNLMIGGGALMFETGLGLNYLYVYKNYNDSTGTFYNDNVSYLGITGRVGLRYQKQHSIFFRGGYTPMYSLLNYDKIPVIAGKRFISMFGLGVGYTF